MTADVRDCVYRALAEAIAPVNPQTVSQWADANRILTRGWVKGPWVTDRMPHLREPMDCLSVADPTEEVVLWFASQTGKTSCGDNWLGYIVDLGLGDVMLVVPTSGTGKRSSRTRIGPLLETTPCIRDKLAEDRRSSRSSNTLSLKAFPGGFLMIAGANSPSELKMEPVRFVFLDEVDEYEADLAGQGHPVDLAKVRQNTYGSRRKTLITSTATVRGRSDIERRWEASDQSWRYVPCPHCQTAQRLRWEQFRWAMGHEHELICGQCAVISVVDAAATQCPACSAEGAPVRRQTEELLEVWYECEACRERIDEVSRPAMLAAGQWRAHLPARSRKCRGFRLPAWYSPPYTWRQAVESRLIADKDPTGVALKTWLNTVAAETYEEPGEQPNDHELLECVETSYRLGVVPDGALLLTCGVDTQDNRLEAKVYGWGPGGECWFIDSHVIHGSPGQFGEGSVWEGLEHLLDKAWPCADGSTLRLRGMGIDEGGHYTQEVRLFAHGHSTRSHPVLSVKGTSHSGKPVISAGSLVDIDYRGRKLKQGIKVWSIGTDTAKLHLYSRLQATQIAHRNGRTSGKELIHFGSGTPAEYFRQLTGERLVSRATPNGYLKDRWVKPQGARVEELDCWVYAYAIAHYLGLNRINWETLRRNKPPPEVKVPEIKPAARGFFNAPRRPNWVNSWRS